MNAPENVNAKLQAIRKVVQVPNIFENFVTEIWVKVVWQILRAEIDLDNLISSHGSLEGVVTRIER